MIIYKNEIQIKLHMEKSAKVLPVVQKLIELLHAEDIQPTVEHLAGFYSQGVEYVKTVLLNKAAPGVQKLDIAEKLKRELLNKAMFIDEKAFTQVFTEMHPVFGRAGVSISDIEIQDGKPVLSEKFTSQIEQNFSVVLDTVEKQEFWQQLKYLSDAWNRLEELAETMGETSLKEHLDPSFFSWLTFEEKGKYCRVYPDANGFINQPFIS